jgi:hypothetical protein
MMIQPTEMACKELSAKNAKQQGRVERITHIAAERKVIIP